MAATRKPKQPSRPRDEDKDDEPEESALPTYDPEFFVVVSHETLNSLMAMKKASDDEAARLAQNQAAQEEKRFVGQINTIDQMQKTLAAREQRIDTLQERLDDKSSKIAELQFQLAEKERVSEEAILEREKLLEAERRREHELEVINARLAAAEQARVSDREAWMKAMGEFGQYLLPGAFSVLAAWAKKQGFGDIVLPQVAPGLPKAPEPKKGSGQKLNVVLSPKQLAEWRQLVSEAFSRLDERGAMALRAAILGAIPGVNPDLPQVEAAAFLPLLAEAMGGPDGFQKFLDLTAQAWEPAQQTSVAPNNAAN